MFILLGAVWLEGSGRNWGHAPDLKRLTKSGLEVSLSGRLVKQEENTIYIEDVEILDLEETSYSLGRLAVYLNQSERFSLGNILEVKGILSTIDAPSNPGQFDSPGFYQNQNIYYTVYNASAAILDDRVDVLTESMRCVKEQLCASLDKAANGEAAMLRAVALGDKKAMSEEQKTRYQNCGIAHMFAISGMHMSLIGMGLYSAGRRVGIPVWLCSVLCTIILSLYGYIVGFSVSTLRALIMFGISVGARCLGRTYDQSSALSLAAIVLLIRNPASITNSSFIFSFGAVLALLYAVPVATQIFHCRRKITRTLLTCVSMQIVLLPLQIYFFFSFPLYSAIGNLIILPFLPLLLASALIGAIAGIFFPPLGALLTAPAVYITKYIDIVTHLIVRLPYSRLVLGQPSIVQIILFYLVLAGILYLVYRSREDGSIIMGRRKKVLIVFGLISLLLICVVRDRRGLQVTFLDVGQGDCIFIKSPEDITYLVDGGSTDVKKAGQYRILPFLMATGTGYLDYAIITHADEDHINGILEILERQKSAEKQWLTGEYSELYIRNLILPRTNMRDDAFLGLREMALEAGCQVYYIETGDVFSTKSMVFECIHPSDKFWTQSRNEYSTVLLLNYDSYQLLLTGDVEGAGEMALIKELEAGDYFEENTVHILKAAHHGSAYTTDEKLLNIVQPRWSVISCGKNNRYGHPHPELITRLEQWDSRYFITAENGAVTLHVKDGKIQWKTFLQK